MRYVKPLILAFGFLMILFGPVFAAQETYPQIEIGGQKRWLYGKYEVNPPSKYFLAIGDTIAPSPSGPWTEELSLYIGGKLNEDLELDYDLQQLSDVPDRYDFRAAYQNYELHFGAPGDTYDHLDHLLQDKLSGTAIGGKWGSLKVNLFTGGYPKGQYESAGANYSSFKLFRDPDYNGDRSFSAYYKDDPYLELLGLDLGRFDVAWDSVEVTLNKRKLVKNLDYFVDEMGGLVLIKAINKDKGTAVVAFTTAAGAREEKRFDLVKDAPRRAFLSPELRILENGETITVDGVPQIRDIDYRANYNLGLFIMARPVRNDAEVRLDYNYTVGANLYASETITGQTGTTFTLAHKNIIRQSESVIKNGLAYTLYSLDRTNGTITFMLPLTAADTVEVSYSYTGVRQDAAGGQVEYQLSAWSRVGLSAATVTPAKDDEWLYGQIVPSSYTTYNLYGQTAINKDTNLAAEVALSSRVVDTRVGGTTEADSAVKLTGQTRVGSVAFSGTYRKTGLNFASTSKVKTGSGAKDEKLSLNARINLFSNFAYYFSCQSGAEQPGGSATQESAVANYESGIEYRPFDYWQLAAQLTHQRDEQKAQGIIGQQTSAYCYSRLELDKIITPLYDWSKSSCLIYKHLSGRNVNDVSSGLASSTTLKSWRNELGWLTNFKGGVTAYLNYKTETDNDATGTMNTYRMMPFYRLAYNWELGGGQAVELYGDFSPIQQRGPTAYNKNETAYGFLWKGPVDNPVLTGWQIGSYYKLIKYADIQNSANDYDATEIRLQTTLAF